MKFALPALCLAVSIPAAVVSASSGRLQGGGARPIQAEKATAAESAAAKAVRSLETKVRCLCENMCCYFRLCSYVYVCAVLLHVGTEERPQNICRMCMIDRS
mmetsp:Transcript_5587/g.15721  ORF Transcript_5587/g.15721 Transcript_5587/m.15721 type:complete len:102 (-) Transcript_5587:96-401(-)